MLETAISGARYFYKPLQVESTAGDDEPESPRKRK